MKNVWKRKSEVSIRSLLVGNFLLVIGILALSLLGVQYLFSVRMVEKIAGKSFDKLAREIRAKVDFRERQAYDFLRILSRSDLPKIEGEKALLRRGIRLLATPMEANNRIYAVYVGYADGSFFEVINLKNSRKLHRYFHAPGKARWLLLRADTVRKIKYLDYYDRDLNLISSRSERSDYDPRERPWYLEAVDERRPIRTDTYLFYNLRQPGITYSQAVRSDKGTVRGVVALDMTLWSLHEYLASLKFQHGMQIALINADATVLSSSESSDHDPAVSRLSALFAGGRAGTILRYRADGKKRLAQFLPLRNEKGDKIWLAFGIDEETLIRPYVQMIFLELGIGLLVILALIPLLLGKIRAIEEPIRALMKENRKIDLRRFWEVQPVRTGVAELDHLSRSMEEMSKKIWEHEKQMRRLLDGIIQLIADAIDAKSPHTGEHCRRVPVLALSLLEAAHGAEEGKLAEFRLEGEEALEEFRRAAWLHDCGKMTTPSFIMEKATKLETIYNRIHELRTRFEVLLRDVRIRYYQELLAGKRTRTELEKWRDAEERRLREEYAFVAGINNRQIELNEENKRRLEQIASQTWMRHFERTLGLSKEELKRWRAVHGRERERLPVRERLITDRKEDRIPRETQHRFDGEDSRMKIQRPELLYHRGELYNLMISSGTLTPEERFKINEHAVYTLRMLESLPWPETMKRIPEYAAAHHERLDGSGYPRALKADELSIPSRIMAIADVFEAITSVDRPYKEGKSLRETLEVMAEMVRRAQLDRELFCLFVTREIYLEYAKEFLRPEQLDRVDARHICSLAGATAEDPTVA